MNWIARIPVSDDQRYRIRLLVSLVALFGGFLIFRAELPIGLTMVLAATIIVVGVCSNYFAFCSIGSIELLDDHWRKWDLPLTLTTAAAALVIVLPAHKFWNDAQLGWPFGASLLAAMLIASTLLYLPYSLRHSDLVNQRARTGYAKLEKLREDLFIRLGSVDSNRVGVDDMTILKDVISLLVIDRFLQDPPSGFGLLNLVGNLRIWTIVGVLAAILEVLVGLYSKS